MSPGKIGADSVVSYNWLEPLAAMSIKDTAAGGQVVAAVGGEETAAVAILVLAHREPCASDLPLADLPPMKARANR